MITLRRYLNNTEAELALGRLRADGVSCQLQNTGLQNISHAMVEILLQVDEDELVLAESILQTVESGDLERDTDWGALSGGDSPY